MRTTVDIIGLIVILALAMAVKRKQITIDRLKKAIWELVDANNKMFEKIDRKSSEG